MIKLFCSSRQRYHIRISFLQRSNYYISLPYCSLSPSLCLTVYLSILFQPLSFFFPTFHTRKILSCLVKLRPQDTENQVFSFTSKGLIRNDKSNRCVDVDNLREGEDVEMKECDERRKSQRWSMYSSKAALWLRSGFLVNEKTHMCLDTHLRKSAQFGTVRFVRISNCNFNCSQVWRISEHNDGFPFKTYDPQRPPIGSKPLKKRGTVSLGELVRTKKAGRILCWILTMPKDHATKATAVNRTWGQDCDILLFASQGSFKGLPIVEVDLGISESRATLWPKSQQMWMYVYVHYKDKADWFIKADDDTCKRTTLFYMYSCITKVTGLIKYAKMTGIGL